MAVAVILEFEGGTIEQYDQVIEKMGLTNGKTPPDALFHWAAKTDGGLKVVDVWESKAAFEKFAEEKIGPMTAEVGMPPPASTTFFDVHNTLSKG